MDFCRDLHALLPLQSATLRVVRFSEEHLQQRYVDWLNDPVVVKFSNQRFFHHTLKSCENFYQSFYASSSVFLAIEHGESGFVGTMTVHFNPHHATADIGILVGARECWGKGIGLQAWQLVLDAVSGLKGMRKVTAGTLSCNIPMLSIMQRSGMSADGIRRAQELVDGAPMDIHYYAHFIADHA